MKNYSDFISVNRARYLLWTQILSLGPLIVGSGRKPGEGLTLNSGYVFGRIHLTQDTISRIQSEFESCALNSFIFVRPSSGELDITIKRNKHVIDRHCMIALDCMSTFHANAQADVEIMFFYVPEHECRSLASRGELHGFVFDLRARCHIVEESLLDELERHLRSGNPDMLRQFKYALLGAMKSSVNYLISSNKLGSKSLKEEVLDFINDNALDVHLSVNTICKEFNISRSTLYRLFSEDLGVAAYITQRRLDQVYSDMLNNQLGHFSLKQIAFNYGFPNAVIFKKQFMERFRFDPRFSRGEKNRPVVENRR